MSIQSIFFDRLTDTGGSLYPLVSTRVYPVKRPQNCAMPCVTHQRITGQRDSAMGSDSGIVRARVQIDAWAETFDNSRAVADAIRAQLQRWRTSGPPIVNDTFILDETEEYDDAAELYRVLLQIDLIYDEG